MNIETRFGLGDYIYYLTWESVEVEEREGHVRQIETFSGNVIVDRLAMFYIPEEYPDDRIMEEFCFATPQEREMWWKTNNWIDSIVRQCKAAGVECVDKTEAEPE